jgi:hypothetical protein
MTTAGMKDCGHGRSRLTNYKAHPYSIYPNHSRMHDGCQDLVNCLKLSFTEELCMVLAFQRAGFVFTIHYSVADK